MPNNFFEELEEEISLSFDPKSAQKPKIQTDRAPLPNHARTENRTPETDRPPREPRKEFVPHTARTHESKPHTHDPRKLHHGTTAPVERKQPHVHPAAPRTKPQAPVMGNKRPDHIAEARTQMSEAGVAVIIFVVDQATRTVLEPIKLETRGLAHLHEAREIHRFIIQKGRAIYEQTNMDVPDIEEKDLLKIIKTDLARFLRESFAREPMIIPVVIGI